MTKFLEKECNIIGLHSEWIGGSELRVRTRSFGSKNRIMIDVLELSPKETSKARATKVARAAAKLVGASADYIIVAEYETCKFSQRLDSDKVYRTKVRHTTFAFGGIE
jgi:hypothetical protein